MGFASLYPSYAPGRPPRASVHAVEKRLARVIVAREVAAEADIVAVAAMNAADDGDLVVAPAMVGGQVAKKESDVRSPLDNPARVVAGQPGGHGIRMRREREGNDGGCEHPPHWNKLLF